MRLLPFLFLLTTALPAQWDLQTSHTTASLRGIHALGHGVAWASGTDGTVLRTTDDGQTWQRCPTPPAAEHLDFRGIQAFDQTTALVMSSGKGDLSRLYKTTDGCQSWKLVFTNPDKDGFFDAVHFDTPARNSFGKLTDPSSAVGDLLGDPVNGQFALFWSRNGGDDWARRSTTKESRSGCKIDTVNAKNGESAFAASNEALLTFGAGSGFLFVTGGSTARLHLSTVSSMDGLFCHDSVHSLQLPIAHGEPSSGAFAIAVTPTDEGLHQSQYQYKVVVVGGNYKKPDDASKTFAVLSPTTLSTLKVSGNTQTPPHGYRSAVAYSPDHKAWITVGPNGTDLSTDDGRNWRALKPGPTEPPDANKNWNALSLPFVVGPKGRIGHLRPDALPK